MKPEQELRIFSNFSPPLLVHPFDELEELFRGFERRSVMTSRILMRAGWCVDESCGRTVPHCGAHRKENKKIQKFGKLRLGEWKKRWVEKSVEKIVTKKNRRIKHADIARKQEVVCLPCMCACKIAGGCGGGNSGEKNRIKKHPGPHGNRQKARGGCLGRLPEVLTYAPAAPVDRRRRRRPSLHFSPTPAACVFRSADRKR